jgi:hypothetical protein
MKKHLTCLTKYADCSGKVMEAGDHFKNGASPKSLMSRNLFKTGFAKNAFVFFVTFVLLSANHVYGQNYSSYRTYDEALESFKEVSKSRGFSAIEVNYTHCKQLRNAEVSDLDETANEFLDRMDITIKWYYRYVGCYVGLHKYTGSVEIKGYISRTSDGRYRYGERSMKVLHYDPEK